MAITQYVVSEDGLTQLCSSCQLWKSIDDYYKCSNTWHGRQARCKECSKENKRRGTPLGRPREIEREDGRIRCSTCRDWKPPEEYHKSKSQRNGLQSYCKVCAKARQNREHNHKAHIKKVYGLTTGEYQAMLVAQSGSCAICNLEYNPERRLCVDHDHDTGSVRGLLCVSCNTGLGALGDDPVRLAAALRYLAKHGKVM